MTRSRLATAAVGVVLSLGVSALVWWATGSVLLFLVVPFVPFLFRDAGEPAETRTCPQCGFRTTDPDHEFCPVDGHRLE